MSTRRWLGHSCDKSGFRLRSRRVSTLTHSTGSLHGEPGVLVILLNMILHGAVGDALASALGARVVDIGFPSALCVGTRAYSHPVGLCTQISRRGSGCMSI